MRSLAWACALFAAGCVNDVRLVLPPGGALGLACVDSTTREPLILGAAQPGGGAAASVVIDYLAFDGVPSCRPTQLVGWCTRLGCPVRQRECVELTVDPPLPMDLPGVQDALVEALRARGPLSADAPDGVVLVRMVLTQQPCAELRDLAQYRCDALLGCVYSCPVQLDEVQGDVLLELDALGTTCDEAVVATCATLGLEPSACVP